MDNREDYGYGWNKRGKRFHALKRNGKRQGRINMMAAIAMVSYSPLLLLRVL
jgi:hypothetical protein